MENDLAGTGISSQTIFDIRRQVRTTDTTLGGVTITTTAIETRTFELQDIVGNDILDVGGRRIEADYLAFCKRGGVDIQERDILSPNSGTTKYEVKFIRQNFIGHLEIFLKRAN